MLDRVFGELGSIDFTGQIKVARYSEPLADLDCLYARIAEARARVPHAQLTIVTNTDYLTPVVLDRLNELGLNVVYMSLYLKSNETWSVELAGSYNERIAAKLGAQVMSKQETPIAMHWTFRYKSLDLRSSCMNWELYGIDRGASMKQFATEQRVGPCRAPFDTFVVDYDGSVVPCCNIRSDLPDHKKMVVGNLSSPETSIFGVYAGRLSAWRRSMVGFGAKAYPCATCRHLDVPEKSATSIGAHLKKRLVEIHRAELYELPIEMNAERKRESASVLNDRA
ncbi:MAG: radical SAM/SPASM domain-containing protein [Chloroflexota bacterium]|nr:radical SAM/SPASM domain-containing protein [Chloroflexota bacterium]